MSTTNTEELKLYKNTKLYNGSRYQFYLKNRASAFQTFLGTPGYSKTVTYKSISEPIQLNEFIKNCDEYTYGSITNEGKTYYFFVDTIITDAYKQTTITFTIDWWTTNWADINCTKAHLTRKPVKPAYMPQPYTPLLPTTSLKARYNGQGCFVFSFIDEGATETDPDTMKFGMFTINRNTAKLVIEGSWQELAGIPDANVLGIWVVPGFDTSDFTLKNWVVYDNTVSLPFLYCVMPSVSDLSTTASRMPSKNITFTSTTISSDETKVQGLVDWYGNSIWECPYGYSVSNFWCNLELGATSCQIRFHPGTATSTPMEDHINELIGTGFTYNCREVPLFIDTGSEYTWRDEDYDKDMRRIQSEVEEWSAVANIFENIGFGAAFGQKSGAQAAGIGSVIEAIGTYAINTVYDPQILQATKSHYLKMQDQMSVVGESATAIWDWIVANSSATNFPFLGVYEITMDTASKTRMLVDESSNGYHCDEFVTNLSSLFTNTSTTHDGYTFLPVFQADNVVVEGACTLAGKQQVVRRLMNGVEFI